MGILRRFREWREDKNGVLTGPDIDANSINTDDGTINNAATANADIPQFAQLAAFSTDFEGETTTSGDFISVSDNDADYLAVVKGNNGSSGGSIDLRFNSDSNSNYNYWDETGSKITGATEIPLVSGTGGSGARLLATVLIQQNPNYSNGFAGLTVMPAPTRELSSFSQAAEYTQDFVSSIGVPNNLDRLTVYKVNEREV